MSQPEKPFLRALAAIAVSLPLLAQTTMPPQIVTDLSLERRLTLSNALTSTDLTFAPDRLQSINSGALELRERLIYNPTAGTLTSTIFTVLSGSPAFSIDANITSGIVGQYTLNIEKTYSVTKPRNILAFTGTVSSSSPNGVLGDVSGAPFSVSMVYTNDTPPKIIDLVVVIAGRVVEYSKDATGTLNLPKPITPVTPPTGAQINISAPTVTTDRQISLDASKTTDASNTSLTYVWKNVNKSAAILNPNTSVAIVQFSEGFGDYIFELTVTNGNGVVTKKTVTISYLGR